MVFLKETCLSILHAVPTPSIETTVSSPAMKPTAVGSGGRVGRSEANGELLVWNLPRCRGTEARASEWGKWESDSKNTRIIKDPGSHNKCTLVQLIQLMRPYIGIPQCSNLTFPGTKHHELSLSLQVFA